MPGVDFWFHWKLNSRATKSSKRLRKDVSGSHPQSSYLIYCSFPKGANRILLQPLSLIALVLLTVPTAAKKPYCLAPRTGKGARLKNTSPEARQVMRKTLPTFRPGPLQPAREPDVFKRC